MALMTGVRNWLASHVPARPDLAGVLPVPSPSIAPPTPAMRTADVGGSPIWPDARVAVVDRLWGEGFVFPGGEEETLRLARPLGLTAAASLLLLGVGGGGPSQAIATQLGVWVTGFEADPHLAARAAERSVRGGLGRRAPVEVWYPAGPTFRANAFHHGMALEPLRGARPEPLLSALREALKTGGQLVLTELVAEASLDPADPVAAGWAALDHRGLALPSETTITRMLGRLGFDVRVVEDISERHCHLAALGWRQALAAVTGRPSVEEAAMLVREAELWLLRLRLIRSRKMRLMRWHGIGTAGWAG